MIIATLFAVVAGQGMKFSQSPKVDPDAKRVLVVYNSLSQDGKRIAEHYMKMRSVPKQNLLAVSTTTADNVPWGDYTKQIENPTKEKIKSIKSEIDFVVVTKGIPLRLNDDKGFAVDAHLACMDLPFTPIQKPTNSEIDRARNPYFGQKSRFTFHGYGFRLVTRLDGYTADDAMRLVNNSVSAKKVKGAFFFERDPSKDRRGTALLHQSQGSAINALKGLGYVVESEESEKFGTSASKVMGYTSWGSNDENYSKDTYKRIQFWPGAIGETFVSTSARTFGPVTGGQSVISDLIERGITGVKGYVSEPYTFALAQPHILFDRYVSGFNLAESFYMASPVLKWKDIVIGDPLCRPFK